jgi:hypothetical protein
MLFGDRLSAVDTVDTVDLFAACSRLVAAVHTIDVDVDVGALVFLTSKVSSL